MMTLKEAEKHLKDEIQRQENYYYVIVDGNFHKLPSTIITRKDPITVKKCKKIVEKVEKAFNIDIKCIKIMMSQYDYKSITPDEYISVICGDYNVKRLVNKNAYYYPKRNRLIIWEDDMPVYENDNGIICRDEVALADCLM